MRPRLPFVVPTARATTGVARSRAGNAAVVSALAALMLAFGAGCDRPPSADSLKEWTQADHHSSDDDKLAAGAQVPTAASKGAGDVAQLVDITWRQQCATCHGPMGRGDGQMGPMVQAPDLTRADWQSKVTDAEMAAIIKGGRNRMPAFGLPDSVLAALVGRIRSLRAP
jgi:mono/diheme cytochrome c family protein